MRPVTPRPARALPRVAAPPASAQAPAAPAARLRGPRTCSLRAAPSQAPRPKVKGLEARGGAGRRPPAAPEGFRCGARARPPRLPPGPDSRFTRAFGHTCRARPPPSARRRPPPRGSARPAATAARAARPFPRPGPRPRPGPAGGAPPRDGAEVPGSLARVGVLPGEPDLQQLLGAFEKMCSFHHRETSEQPTTTENQLN